MDHGVLKGFLLGRSPITRFPHSNGHGRAQPGLAPVARQGNLLVESAKQMPYAKLRDALIDEVKRQGKPYGLVFQDISGGFTNTRTGGNPQAFKVLPLVVTRVVPGRSSGRAGPWRGRGGDAARVLRAHHGHRG